MNSLRLSPLSYAILLGNHCLQILRNPVALNSYPCPPVRSFFCVYEVVQSPHENNMSGANTESVLARFRDNNWKKGRDFAKTFYVKKLM